MSNPVSAVAGPVVSLGFGVARVPVGLLARLTGNGDNPEWGPTLAVDSVEAGVRQVLGSLLGDPGLAGQGEVQDARVTQRTEAAERDAAADARREVADQRLGERRESDQQARQRIREQEKQQRDRLEAQRKHREQEAEQREKQRKEQAQKAEARAQEVADQHAHEAHRTRVEAESEAVAAEREAAERSQEALELAEAKDAARRAR